MIDFKGRNCAELQERIRSAGYWLAEVDGVWQSSDESAVQAVIDGFTLAEFADMVCARIESLAEAKRGAVYAAGNFGVFEASGWALKLREANAYTVSGDPNDAPFLQREATRGGIPLADLVNRVLTNAALLAPMEADIAGEVRRHKDAVRALTTHAQIMTYDYSTGWPL